MAGTREVKFFNDGVYYASITIAVSEDGKKQFIPSPGFELYPMDIDGADPSMYGYDPELIVFSKVGNRRCRRYLTPVKEGTKNALMRSEWAEIKKEERSHRCMIPGKNGGMIVCSNKSCYGCENAYRKETSGREVSLDALQENSNWDPAMEGEDSNSPEMIVCADMVEEQFNEYLAGIQDDLAKVDKMNRAGCPISEISEALGVKDRTVYYDLKRIEKYREQFAKQFI